MNVLILTPDRVGSTLLQRLVTIYMLRKDFGQPVINLHELSNGLVKYYSDVFNQEVLGKPEGTEWGYFQSLPEVIDLLDSTDHYKTSRLAHYHMIRRRDSIDDQIKFYEYLNRNFFVISCRRNNIFEYALSWAIHAHSKTLNVYSIKEKVLNYRNIYRDGITITRPALEVYLNNYVRYDKWVADYFNVQSYFDYDHDINNIEQYILDLPFMQNSQQNTWQDMFGQSFADWNTCHRMLPNLLLHDRASQNHPHKITISKNPVNDSKWKQLRGPDWPQNWQDIDKKELPVTVREEINNLFEMVTVPVSDSEYNFLSQNIDTYRNTQSQIETLRENGFMVSGVPIKLQSLQEKQHIIKNFSECVEWYNQWVEKNNYGQPYTMTQLDQIAQQQEQDLGRPMQQLENLSHKILGRD